MSGARDNCVNLSLCHQLTRPLTTESVFYFFVSAAVHAQRHEDATNDIISSHAIEQHLEAVLR